MAANMFSKSKLSLDVIRILFRNYSVACSCQSYGSNTTKFSLNDIPGRRKFMSNSVSRSFSNSSSLQSKWLDITFVKGDGEELCVPAKEGDTLLDVVVNNDLDFDGYGICEGGLSCSTCHLILNKTDHDKLGEITEEERDMLDMAYGYCDTNTFDCVSFAGCGFLSPYLIGAASCLLKERHTSLTSVKFCGASAGSLLAAVMACGLPLDTVRKSVMDTVRDSRSRVLGPFSPNFNIEDYLRDGLRDLPPDAHLIAKGRLFVSLTKKSDKKSILISDWKSREELIQCLLCSCFIPGFSGFQYPVYRGEKCLDGGFSNNLPIVGKRALTISPFAGKACVCPKDPVNGRRFVNMGGTLIELSTNNVRRLIRALIPLSTVSLDGLFQTGYQEMSAFFGKISRKM